MAALQSLLPLCLLPLHPVELAQGKLLRAALESGAAKAMMAAALEEAGAVRAAGPRPLVLMLRRLLLLLRL